MHAGHRHLAAGPEPVDVRATARVGDNAAHVVVGGRSDRHRLAARVVTRLSAQRQSLWEARLALRRERWTQVEQDPLSRGGTPRDRPGDDVAGRQLRLRVLVEHEPAAGFVQQQRARPAQRFRQERQARAVAVLGRQQRRRMKLYELEIGEPPPARTARARPSPVPSAGLVVSRHRLPIPPVASTTWLAWTRTQPSLPDRPARRTLVRPVSPCRRRSIRR